MTTRMATYAADLKAALEDRLVPLEGGPLDGQLMLSAGVLQEVIATVPTPPVDEHGAELRTPATVYLDALCHICGESSRVVVNLESKTTVDDKRRIIAAKIDTEAAVHFCGQMPLPVGSGYGSDVAGQEAFDWTIPVEDVSAFPSVVVDFLGRVGVTVPEATVDGWTEAEREAAMSWAVAVHVARESGEDIPEAPEVVARDGHPSIVVGGPPEDDAPDPTVCPFPDCEKPAEHRGQHGKPRSRKPSAGEADNADGSETHYETPLGEDIDGGQDDLLPE